MIILKFSPFYFIHTGTCLETVRLVVLKFDVDEYFLLYCSSLRIKSELIPIDRHFVRRQAVQFRRVSMLTSHDSLNKHGRTLYKKYNQ
jgi:hypothetical protein